MNSYGKLLNKLVIVKVLLTLNFIYIILLLSMELFNILIYLLKVQNLFNNICYEVSNGIGVKTCQLTAIRVEWAVNYVIKPNFLHNKLVLLQHGLD
jgi:hypothetical protein